jgi:nucleoside diphosphate kinase
LDGNLHTTKKNKEPLVVCSKETGLEVNADKTKYMVMSRDQNAGRNYSIRKDNYFFETLKHFIYLGTALMNQNSIQEEMKSSL